MDSEIKILLDDMKLCDRIFDTVRFVDPIQKRVVDYKNDNVNMHDIHCFDFWGKNKVCDNCISIRAYNNNQTFVKIEYNESSTFMITAIPFELSYRRIVIEMIKDVTECMSFGTNGEGASMSIEIHSMIDNMNNLALKDSLTQIYNRRYIDEKLPIDLINSVLLSQPLSIIMTDIDSFKNVNDTYGHLTGDCVLKSFAETISECVRRGGDWIARYGGEEFLVCLPGADIETAKEIAERMRKTVEEEVFRFEDNDLRITASFGIYCTEAKPHDSIHELISRADKKLYLAKSSGKNRVEF